MEDQLNPKSDEHAEDSVLGRVLSERQSQEISAVRPSKIVQGVLNRLRERERDILAARYGLASGRSAKETLESIGQRLSVTRERIRQIEKAALKKISKKFSAAIKPLWKVIGEYLTTYGGVVDLSNLARHFQIDQSEDTELEQNALRLAMTAHPEAEPLKKHPLMKEGWISRSADQNNLVKIQEAAIQILEKYRQPISEDKLVEAITKVVANVSSAVAKGALRISSGLGMDSKGNWGLSIWPIIVPRRIRDKVFIVLEEANQPLHFEEITKLIQKKFRAAKPVLSRTVHNELISDKRFVLVGRGIYALKSWGYKPGVVSDVIKEVLASAGRPLPIAEIIEEVMKRRRVKRNTVVANLQDRSLFKKVAKATYALVPAEEKEGES